MRWIKRFFGIPRPGTLPAPVPPDEALRKHADWRVAEALGPAEVRRPENQATAWQHIERLDGRQLLDFDSEVRLNSWTDGTSRDLDLLAFAATDSLKERATAYRFTAACSRDGYVRQQALRDLRGDSSRLALAAGLIRSRDWVPEVRAEAAGLILEELWSPSGELVFGVFDLYLMLQRQSRGDWGGWQDLFEKLLRSPKSRAARWQATRHESGVVRQAAYELVLEADPDRLQEGLLQAMEDRSCRIVQWALAHARATADGALIEAVLERAHRHRHPGVRAEALRARHALAPDALRLRAAALDRARCVRNAAAHALRNDFRESPLPIWRGVIDCGPSKNLAIAQMALAEHAEPGDEPWLRELSTNSTPRLRVAALQALSRLSVVELGTYLARALEDASPRVVSQALRIYKRGNEPLDFSRVSAVYEAASSCAMKITLFNAAVALGKWDGLAFLLDCARDPDAELFRAIEPHLRRWHVHANSSFAPLADSRCESLRSALATARNAHPRFSWDRIENMF